MVSVGAPSAGPIPASAGEPFENPAHSAPRRAYPRVRGGTRKEYCSEQRLPGLSPRPRGNHRGRLCICCGLGPIPASAGEPFRSSARSCHLRAYPRVRGGTIRESGSQRAPQGLSPRPRGNREFYELRSGFRRPIPASAGEPNGESALRFDRRAYPRVCGGTISWRRRWRVVQGLSPRPRGNPGARTGRRGECGPIPASAGEPSAGDRHRTGSRAYPRVRGGTSAGMYPIPLVEGLSPRPRGNPSRRPASDRKIGPIPASAGEPIFRRLYVRSSRAYPRVRGGTRRPASGYGCRRGLSPRPRGNRRRMGRGSCSNGPIPASAGEPRS